MRNIYNKGKYRNGEWAKHLRPFLKKVGNRKWRIDGKTQITSELLHNDQSEPENENITLRVPRKRKKKIKARITTIDSKGKTFSSTQRFYSLKALKSSVIRNNVTHYHVYDENK